MRSFDPTSERIANDALARHPRACIAFSGGLDSLTLVDFVTRFTPHRPTLLWVNPGVLEFPETEPFIRETADRYGLPLAIVRVDSDPIAQWERHGFPLLGKSAAATWTKSHKGFGFRLSCSDCCGRRKIEPARRWMRQNGFTAQLVATRRADSKSRDLRTQKDGTSYQTDGIEVSTPISHWTDLRSRVYVSRYKPRLHPRRADGTASNIGCQSCGGGSQFETSNFRQMRFLRPDLWRETVRTLGPLLLAIKYNAPLPRIQEALARLGGLERLMAERPHVFDFSRVTPLESYRR